MKHLLVSIIALALFSSCNEDFLGMKPDQKQRVPSTVSDYQALLDYSDLMNGTSSHTLGLIGADQYYIIDARYNTFPSGVDLNYQKQAYTWEDVIYQGGEVQGDWPKAYARILNTNIALDGLSIIEPEVSDQPQWNNGRGCALFHRAMNYYNLAQLFCGQYHTQTASALPGLPLRLEADLTLSTPRSTVKKTYQQIISDLKEAAELLPEKPLNVFRPSKPAAYALLARTYLQMADYRMGLEYADLARSFGYTLINYNELNLSLANTFPVNGLGNPEVIFNSYVANVAPLNPSFYNMEAKLLESYDQDDLRYKAYFYSSTDNRILFKGSYTGKPSIFFTGLAVDELYLIRAECNQRIGNAALAVEDLNKLLLNRYKTGSFIPYNVQSGQDMLRIILNERYKELVFRGTRWGDLRRLNLEPVFATPLRRNIGNNVFGLLPADPRWVWPLPPEAITAGGYVQNQR